MKTINLTVFSFDELSRRIITNGLTRTEMKNILLKISQKRILDGIGEDIPYQKNPLIK